MRLAKWSVRNRVAANLLTIVLLISGFLAASTRLKLDLFPDVSTNFLSVVVLDPSTSAPEEIERSITIPIEEELENVRGVQKIYSTSEDNLSTIFLEIESSIRDINPVLNEVRQAVDKAKPKLPASIEPLVIESFDVPFPLITFTVSYPACFDLTQIRDQMDALLRSLKMIPGVSKVLVDGLDRREIWIEIDPFKLAALGVCFDEVASAVSAKNRNFVAGRLDGAGGQRLIRLLGQIQSASELEALPIKSRADGSLVLLRDVATFKDRSEKERTVGRANLRPAITFTIVKQKGADAIKTVAQCRKIFIEGTANLPPSVETQILSDTTRFIRVRINTVVQNGIQALLLVTVLLMLLLNWRMALVVAIGIPISFAGTFLVLYFGGFTINLLSLFGMIMALGMVVDDAIVISENAYRYIEQGVAPAKAAVLGAREVFWPVVGSVSTTVAAFLPLLCGEGIIGKFLVIVPIVVISTLCFSLLQAFVVLPSHIADCVRKSPTATEIEATTPPDGLFARILRIVRLTYAEMREAVDTLLRRVIEIYTYLLVLCLRWRYFCISGFLALLLLMGIILSMGVIPFKLFSTDFADILIVKTELPADFSLEQTADVIERLERRIVETLPADDYLAILTRVGARLDTSDQFLEYGTNLAMITLDLDEENPAARKPSQIERSLQALLLEFPEFVSATAKSKKGGPPVGKAVNVEIQGPDFHELQAIAARVEERLRQIPGTVNIGNDFPAGKTELRIRIDEARAARAGLDVASVGRALTAVYRGLEAARIRWGNQEVILRVKAAEQFQRDPELLLGFRVKNRHGRQVDLSSIAEIDRATGVARIKRLNAQRVITVSADIDERATTSATVNSEIAKYLRDILADHPGYRIQLTGENENTERSLAAMKFASVVAVLLIYTLLAVITNSFLQPVVIMAVIPFGIVGVILGLILMGEPMGLMSVMGTVALAGIVVNNSVVLVDFVNQHRHKATGDTAHKTRHHPLLLPTFTRWRSILLGGRRRFRPVFLTTATTVAGLANLAFTSSGQEQFLAPMAQAIIFGLSFASLITMLLIPCLYSVLDDLHRLVLIGRTPRQTTN
jgi:multidrug efflux pump subunit AcrB